MNKWTFLVFGLLIFGLGSTASAAVVDNNKIYIWSDPFGDEYDNYAEVAPGDSVTVTVVVNDLNGSVDMTTGNTLVNNNWTHASNGARTGVWWDTDYIVDTSSPDYVQADGVGTNFRQYWSTGGYVYWTSYLNHSWGEHYDGDVVWVAEGRRLINFTFTIREDAPVGTSTTLGLNTRFFWSNNMFDPYGGYFFADQIDSGDALAMEFYIVPNAVPGDIDGDGDVDGDDVDDLCANIGGDPGTYDMDGDGDVDEDDMVFHVENLLEYDTDGDSIVDGQGTFRGDFNADGAVNGTDLSIMNGNFGTTAGYAGGNANCDTTVNGTDLSILAGSFGNVVTAAVPEPASAALLVLGGCALLKRRRRHS